MNKPSVVVFVFVVAIIVLVWYFPVNTVLVDIDRHSLRPRSKRQQLLPLLRRRQLWNHPNDVFSYIYIYTICLFICIPNKLIFTILPVNISQN